MQAEYDSVLNHLHGQRGLIKKAERLDELGVKARKKLPEKFRELANSESEYIDYEEA